MAAQFLYREPGVRFPQTIEEMDAIFTESEKISRDFLTRLKKFTMLNAPSAYPHRRDKFIEPKSGRCF
jgi:hypothetical protein